MQDLAASIGAKVDILINNAEFHRSSWHCRPPWHRDCARGDGDQLSRTDAAGAKLRPGDARTRGGRHRTLQRRGSISCRSTRCHRCRRRVRSQHRKRQRSSLSQTLRAEMRHAGIRVVNVFPGPIDDEWTQLVPPPKLAPAALAKAVVKALRDGVEDIYPGDVAQDLFNKWRQNAQGAQSGNVGSMRRNRDHHPSILREMTAGAGDAAPSHRRPDANAVATLSANRAAARIRSMRAVPHARKSRITMTVDRAGTGIIFRSANTPARISMRRSTGSPAAIFPTTHWIPCPAQTFVAPASVIDCSAEAQEDADFLLTADRLRLWEKRIWAYSRGLMAADAHGLVETHRSRCLPELRCYRTAFTGA